MNSRSIAAAVLAASFLALAPLADAQTAQQRLAEAIRLQQAIHRQDAAGDLDAAIATFRELASSPGTDRAVAAEAQYRLAQSLLQKGELDAAAQETMALSRLFPDQAELVSRLTGNGGPGSLLARTAAMGPSSLPAGFDFEPGTSASIAGRITRFAFVNPMSWLTVTDGASTWTLGVAAPNLLRQLGLNLGMLKPGDDVRIDITLDRRGPVLTDGTILGRADSIVRAADGVQVFNRAALGAPQP
jgi:tetratricopeptide (TPR) repeat protein